MWSEPLTQSRGRTAHNCELAWTVLPRGPWNRTARLTCVVCSTRSTAEAAESDKEHVKTKKTLVVDM